MSPQWPSRTWIVLLVSVALLVGAVGVADVDARSVNYQNSDYSMSLSRTVEIPARTASFEGDEYLVSEVGRYDPGQTISVDVSAPDGREYRVQLYNEKSQVVDSVAMNGSGTATFDTDAFDPGTYALAVYESGTIYDMVPVVVQGYTVRTSVPGSVEQGSTVTVDVSLTREAVGTAPSSVEVVLGNASASERVTADRVGDDQYRAEVGTDSLESGTYLVYGVARGDRETDDGEKVVLGMSDASELEVSEPTPTPEPSSGGGGGGGGGAATTPTGTAGPTETSTPTPPGRSPTPSRTSTPTVVSQTPTATSDGATSPASGTTSPSLTATASVSPTATDGPVTPAPSPSPTVSATETSGSGAGFGVVVAVVALLGVGALRRRR